MQKRSTYIQLTGSIPVTLEIAKNYLRVSHSADDDFIQLLINEATKMGQRYSDSQFTSAISGVIVAVQPSFKPEQSALLELNYPNSNITLTSVKVGAETLASTDYTLEAGNVLKLNNQPEAGAIIEVKYTATVSESVDISLGILKLVADAYENRTEQSVEPLSRVKVNAHRYFQLNVSGGDLF